MTAFCGYYIAPKDTGLILLKNCSRGFGCISWHELGIDGDGYWLFCSKNTYTQSGIPFWAVACGFYDGQF